MTDETASIDARTPEAEATAAAPPQVSFNALGLGPETLRAVEESGYTTPTPIQAQAIPHVLAGRDVLGIAQTGTGKTASFTLPMIDILSRGRAKARMPRTLILEPTRELAAQVAENFTKYGKYHNLTMALLIGGVSFGDQDALLAKGVDVLIATPGRLLDHFERGKLLLTGVQVMVVDEADRMLDMGFIPDIERIFKLTPFTRQTLFFSATMPPEIQRIVDQFLSNAVRVEVTKPASTASTITAKVVRIPSGDPRTRRGALRAVLQGCTIKNGIIFCNRKSDVDVVAKSLQRHGFDAAPIHGDLDQSLRTKTLDRFRSGDLKLLVASDVAARGLDIPDVSHVFNYEPTRSPDDYVHRIGRTGRAGRSGEAFTLIAPEDTRSLAAIEKLIGQAIDTASFEGLPDAPLGDRSDRGGRGRMAEELKSERRTRRGGPKRDAEDARPPRESRAAREPREARDSQAPRESRPPRADNTPNRDRRPQRGEPRDRDEVVGFGDSTPAFLMQGAGRRGGAS